MANLQFYPEDHDYVNKKLDEYPGSFLKNFLWACRAADAENYELLKPILQKIKEKYPLRG